LQLDDVTKSVRTMKTELQWPGAGWIEVRAKRERFVGSIYEIQFSVQEPWRRDLWRFAEIRTVTDGNGETVSVTKHAIARVPKDTHEHFKEHLCG